MPRMRTRTSAPLVTVGLTIGLAIGLAAPLDAQTTDAAATREPAPIDFAKLDRTPPKLPKLNAPVPQFGMLLFGAHAEKRVWVVLDKSDATAEAYDVMYLDKDADGDLTEDGERIACEVAAKAATPTRRFVLGDFTDPGTGAVHTDASFTWTAKRFSFRMKWRGQKTTMGLYGPDSDSYGQLGATPAQAPVVVPGWDRPFEFERWYGGELTRGADTEFKVFVGNRGSGTGLFTCVDDKFLPASEHPIATLLYETKSGERCEVATPLLKRC